MAGDSGKEVVGDIAGEVAVNDTEKTKNKKQKKKGLLSRIWNGIFRLHGDDFEKRLQYISKEEAAVLARMKRRSQSWRRMTRHLIILSVLLECMSNSEKEIKRIRVKFELVIAVGYAIMTTRSLDLDWKMRALRVLPMFLLPGLSFLTYSALGSFTRMCDRKDQKTLERLRAERQAKIDELKEKTNYYTTQQLIQRYDPDPAVKAAAATVLASKLGADSGLKVYVGDESKLNAPTGKSSDVELVQPGGLRNRKQLHNRVGSQESTIVDHPDVDMLHHTGLEGPENAQHHQMVVEHFQPKGSSTHDGGWLARLAALLVGEDPTQSYALICGNCHMHNGLARKEDFPYITYYCPHCNALNRPKQQDNSPNVSSPSTIDSVGGEIEVTKKGSSPVVDRVSTSSPLAAAGGSTETDKVPSEGSGS